MIFEDSKYSMLGYEAPDYLIAEAIQVGINRDKQILRV